MSTTKCKKCKGESIKFETFINLSLPIVRNGNSNLMDCFREFSKPETLNKENE